MFGSTTLSMVMFTTEVVGVEVHESLTMKFTAMSSTALPLPEFFERANESGGSAAGEKVVMEADRICCIRFNVSS